MYKYIIHHHQPGHEFVTSVCRRPISHSCFECHVQRVWQTIWFFFWPIVEDFLGFFFFFVVVVERNSFSAGTGLRDGTRIRTREIKYNANAYQALTITHIYIWECTNMVVCAIWLCYAMIMTIRLNLTQFAPYHNITHTDIHTYHLLTYTQFSMNELLYVIHPFRTSAQLFYSIDVCLVLQTYIT